MESSGNNIDLVTTQSRKISKIKKGIPKKVLELFGVVSKVSEKK